MRWLMIGFLVSLGALLLAAAGLARHIWLQRAALDKGVASPDSSLESDVEPDAEPESGRKHEDE